MNFYEELSKKNYYEKTASTKEQITDALSKFTISEMEAIAEELGLMAETEKLAEEGGSLESKVLTQSQKDAQDAAKDKANEDKVEGGQGKTEISQAVEGTNESEAAKTISEKEDHVNQQAAASAGTAQGTNTDTAGNASAGNNQGASATDLGGSNENENGTTTERTGEKDDEKVAMVLAAYDLASEKLASAGYTLADYVFSKVGDEKVAYQIAENAEKLAFVTDQNQLKVADDIIETVYSILEK